MDSSGHVWSEETLKKLTEEDKKKVDELGKLIEILPEDKEVFDMNDEDKQKWYKKMVNQRREFPKLLIKENEMQRENETFKVESADDCVWVSDKRNAEFKVHITKDQAKELGKMLEEVTMEEKK